MAQLGIRVHHGTVHAAVTCRASCRRRSPRLAVRASSGPEDADKPGPRPNLGDPVQVISWGGTLPSTRRLALGSLSAVAIALGGNLGGCTSFLLGLDGGALAERLQLDILVPVRGFKRCVDNRYGFGFVYPADWLGDQTLANRQAQQAEAGRRFPSDPLMSSSSEAVAAVRRRSRSVAEPVVAFGPPGTSGEENVSVVVAPIAPGFELRSMGGPEASGARFLSTIAPEGSGRQTQLLAAAERVDADGQLYYTLDYTMQGPGFFRHNVSVYTTRGNLLYTFNVQCPEARWAKEQQQITASSASFKLLP